MVDGIGKVGTAAGAATSGNHGPGAESAKVKKAAAAKAEVEVSITGAVRENEDASLARRVRRPIRSVEQAFSVARRLAGKILRHKDLSEAAHVLSPGRVEGLITEE